MDILVIWLLIVIPVFFAFGWFAGRIDMKSLMKQAKLIPQRLYDGVDAMVDNKTGLARDELKQVIDQEPQLIDLQFSLGRLYRKRGENDLAIKLHSKLLGSQFVLSKEIKDKIRLELAQDFQKAGLIDRAETTLTKLLNSQLYAHKALEMLLLIYQQDKNWQDAIVTARKLATSNISFHTEVAQFNCELAQESIIKSDYEQAQKYIAYALDTNRKCVRANILLGEVHFNQENYADAISVWQAIEKQNFQYLPFVINKMFEAYQRQNMTKEFLNLIKGYTTLYPQINIYEFVYKTLITHDSLDATLDYLHNLMRYNPSAKIAVLLIDARVEQIQTPDGKNDAQQVKNILVKYDEKNSHYACGCCNFKSKTFFWQCPACYEWESISPNNIEK